MSNLMKIRPVGAAFFHEGGRTFEQRDRQTDMTELIIGFCNFENGPPPKKKLTFAVQSNKKFLLFSVNVSIYIFGLIIG
jgi:hypothetical protein